MAWKAIGTVPAMAMAMGVLLTGTALETGAEAKEAKKTDPSKRVCQSITPSGSRLVKRICRTQQEWDDHTKATQDGLLSFQRNNTDTNDLTNFHAGSPK